MKKIKFLFSAVIAAAILLSLCLPAFAVTSPVIEIGEYSAEAGQSVTVTVSVKNNTGITYLRVTPEFDDALLTLTSVTNGSLFPTLDEGLNIVFSADSEVKTDGVLCILTFTVAEGAELNSVARIGLTVKECYNDRYDDVSITAADGAVTVGCRHTETTDTVTKAPTCTETGEKLRVCDNCGHEVTETVPAVGHVEGEWETTKAPAVGVAGEMAVKCSVCNETVRTQTIPALSGEQSGGQGDVTTPPVSTGCGGGAAAAITVFFTSVLPAAAVFVGKSFLF